MDGDVDQPVGGGLGEQQGCNVSRSYSGLTLQLAGQTAYSAAHQLTVWWPHPPPTPLKWPQIQISGLVPSTLPSTLPSAGPLSPSRNQPPQEKRAILVEFQREVLVTGAAIQEIQVLTGDVGGSVRRVHLDTF